MKRTRYILSGVLVVAVLLVAMIFRVSAATFDSDIVPDVVGAYGLGVSEGDWASINNTIFFSGSNVGVSEPSPTASLHVQGDVRVDDGDVYIDDNGSGVILTDISSVCWRLTVDNGGVIGTATTTCP